MNIAALDFKAHRFQAALDCYTSALAIFRKLLPPDHPHISLALNNIGLVNEWLGRGEASNDAFSDSVAVARRSQTNCSGPGCSLKLRPDGAPLDVCVNCRRTFYCGKACQIADWKREGGHRKECKALVAEGKADAPAK